MDNVGTRKQSACRSEFAWAASSDAGTYPQQTAQSEPSRTSSPQGCPQRRTGKHERKGPCDKVLVRMAAESAGRSAKNAGKPPKMRCGIRPMARARPWCRGPESNWGHRSFQGRALPAELPRRGHAGTTGFEPAISGVTIQRLRPDWTTSPYVTQWARQDSNLRPSGCKPDALPTELLAHYSDPHGSRKRSALASPRGFEPLSPG